MVNQNNRNRLRNRPIEPCELLGVYTALITPMLPGNGIDNRVDYDKLYQLIDDQAKAGVSGIVVAGTTGQSSTLSIAEHIELVRNAFFYSRERYADLQYIAGAGSNSTREAINLSWRIEEAIGPTTFLHVTGYYNNPPQEGIIEHFERVASCLPHSNIILYNVPGRTHSNIDVESVVHLAGTRNIIGIKEASGIECLTNVNRLKSEIDPEEFIILSGEDNLVSRVIQYGGRGVISASANIAPKYFVNMFSEALDENYEEAERLQERINPLIKNLVFYCKNPIPLAHVFDTEVRLPMIKTEYNEDYIRRTLEDFLLHGILHERISSDELGIDPFEYHGKEAVLS